MIQTDKVVTRAINGANPPTKAELRLTKAEPIIEPDAAKISANAIIADPKTTTPAIGYSKICDVCKLNGHNNLVFCTLLKNYIPSNKCDIILPLNLCNICLNTDANKKLLHVTQTMQSSTKQNLHVQLQDHHICYVHRPSVIIRSSSGSCKVIIQN